MLKLKTNRRTTSPQKNKKNHETIKKCKEGPVEVPALWGYEEGQSIDYQEAQNPLLFGDGGGGGAAYDHRGSCYGARAESAGVWHLVFQQREQ